MKKKTTTTKRRMSIPTAVSAECTYVPEIVTNKDVFVSKKYIQMANIAMSDHNMKENTNLEFLEIVKADRENIICSGYFYYLSIKVKARDYEKLKIVHKMVWKGSSMDVLPGCVVVKQVPTTITTLLPVSNARTQKLVILASSRHDNTSEKEKLRASETVVHTQFMGNVPKGAGYIKFTKYHIYFIPKETEKQEQGEIVCISILHRKWLYTLDDSVADSLRRKVLMREDLFNRNHPLVFPPLPKQKKMVSDDVTGTTVKLLEIDHVSPKILSCAWCAVDDYNFEKGAQLELMNILEAQLTQCAGEYFNLTLQAKDQGVLKIFNTRVWSMPWLKSVKVSPLTEVVAPAPKRARKLLDDAPVRVTRSKVAKSTI